MFPTKYRGELQDTLSLFIVAGDAGPLIAILAMRLQISLLDAFSGITARFFFLVRAAFVIAGDAGPFITVPAGPYLRI